MRREWQQQTLALMLAIVVGGTFVYWGYTQAVILVFFGIAITIWASILLGRHLASSPRDGRLWFLMRHRPQDIVWVYSMITNRMPFGLELLPGGIIYFCLVSGDEISVTIPPRKLRLVSRTLNRVLPHATFGYSNERAQLFAADPRKLVRH